MRSLLAVLGSSWFPVAPPVALPFALLGAICGACLDAPPAPGPATARLVAAWDPLACGDPHRVVVELEDDGGDMLSASTPCNLGGLTLDLPHLGLYHGRIYAWALAAPIRSITPIDLTIDQPVVHWQVSTPR